MQHPLCERRRERSDARTASVRLLAPRWRTVTVASSRFQKGQRVYRIPPRERSVIASLARLFDRSHSPLLLLSGYRSMNSKLVLAAMVAALMTAACSSGGSSSSPSAESTPPAASSAPAEQPAAPPAATPPAEGGNAAPPAGGTPPAAPADNGAAPPAGGSAPATPPKQ